MEEKRSGYGGGYYKGAENWYGTSNPKYDAAIHIPLIHKIYEQGDGVVAFCAEAGISKKSFHNWVDRHPEFKENYEIAICKGCAIWEKKPLELAQNGTSLNFNYWMAIARNRYKFYQSKVKKEKENTTQSRLEAAFESLQDGSITPQEYNQIASGLATESRILELELNRKIAENEQKDSEEAKEMTDQALKAYMLVKSGKGKVVELE